MGEIAAHWKAAAGCLLLVVALVMLSRGGAPGKSRTAVSMTHDGLVREALKYYNASERETKPLVKLMYVNYATSYMRLVDFASTDPQLSAEDVFASCEELQRSLLTQFDADLMHAVPTPV
uniref:Uncharacterized protein n=1 Tax=viral metagenome TaxID=1070528 RepID=A0A6C0KF26_9ZZZZ